MKTNEYPDKMRFKDTCLMKRPVCSLDLNQSENLEHSVEEELDWQIAIYQQK